LSSKIEKIFWGGKRDTPPHNPPTSMRLQLRVVRSSLNEESAKTHVHAFVSSRLDYCNSLLYGVYGVSDELLQKLQVIQKAAARVVT